MIDKIYFAKIKNCAILPTKRGEDGCYDIYACSDDDIVIQPHQVKLIPTGISSAFDKKYRIAIRERGSNTKSCLITMAGQIDSGYRGEYFVALYNGNNIPIELTNNITELEKTEDFIRVPMNKAIAQFAIEEVPTVQIHMIDYKDLLNIKSERGIGALGSSEK